MTSRGRVRRLHLAAGIFTVVAFLATGLYMAFHTPPMTALDGAARLMFRSRHIYILAAGLVNTMLGLYLDRQTGWRGTLQVIGSALLLLSPPLLLTAFAVEPARGFREELRWSANGLFALFGGSMAHLAASIGKPSPKILKKS